MNNQFNQFSLTHALLDNLDELKFHSMTPIQAQSLGYILENKDVIGQAKTGSGKTAAFGLGILNSLDTSTPKITGLILCPTRELAEQVAKEIRTLARKMKNVKILTICGGVQEIHQEKSLQHGAHIIVGTPGRVLRLLRKNLLDFSYVKTFVLDEADRMLDMGFYDDIRNIEEHLPLKKQTLLFSATYPPEIGQLSQGIQKDAIEVKVDTEHEENIIAQYFYEVARHQDKKEALLKVLGHYKPDRLIVFCKTKQITDDVAKFLNRHEIFAAAIHGDLGQNERTTVLTKFTNRSLSVLVATDVAARGLDIEDLAAVINFDLPADPEIYIHRIGRTGRAGLKGSAFSFFVAKNIYKLESIEDYTQRQYKVEDLNTIELSKYEQVPPMKTMYVGGGKKNKLRPGDLLGAIVGVGKVDSSDVGNISVFNILSYVAIKSDKIEQVITNLQSGTIKNKKFKVGLA
ncbi:MAG: ATP-dependent RNA helicase DbpA [Halobacteriovoraceae bacterium]|nr:ATP-dependent RNA helicase DbpA [Halobacteriovoraceae bacterium]